MTIHLANGEALPVGSRISLDGSVEIIESGFDGLAYFPNLEGHHQLRVTLPDGAQCQARTAVPADSVWPMSTKVVCYDIRF